MKLSEQKRTFFELTPKFTKASTDLLGKIKVARASSDYLKTLLPEVDEDKNPDIMAVSFDSSVANLINLNDDGILTPQAKSLTPTFLNKPINIEHIKNWVVGSVLTYGFSSFGDGSPLTDIDDADLTPFNICLGGVLWKQVDPYFCDMVRDSTNPFSYEYKHVSASWEVGFDEYVIALGSKNLKDATIITEDAKVAELTPYLKCEGGTGFTKDGTPVYRVIAGNPVAFGIGLTNMPAGNVKGITIASTRPKPEPVIEVTSEPLEQTIAKVVDEKIKNISQSSNLNVKKDTQIMKITDITDITQDALKEVQASEVRDFIKEQLKNKDESFKVELSAEKDKLVKLEAEATAEKAKAAQLATEVLAVKNELQLIKDKNEAAAKEACFAKNLSDAEASFKLDAPAKEIVKAQIKDLDEAGYSAWKKNFEVLFAALKVDVKEKEDAAAKIVAKAKVEKSDVPNGSEGEEETLMQKARKAFSNKKD